MKRALEERKAELEGKVATAAGALNAAEELKTLRRGSAACRGSAFRWPGVLGSQLWGPNQL